MGCQADGTHLLEVPWGSPCRCGIPCTCDSTCMCTSCLQQEDLIVNQTQHSLHSRAFPLTCCSSVSAGVSLSILECSRDKLILLDVYDGVGGLKTNNNKKKKNRIFLVRRGQPARHLHSWPRLYLLWSVMASSEDSRRRHQKGAGGNAIAMTNRSVLEFQTGALGPSALLRLLLLRTCNHSTASCIRTSAFFSFHTPQFHLWLRALSNSQSADTECWVERDRFCPYLIQGRFGAYVECRWGFGAEISYQGICCLAVLGLCWLLHPGYFAAFKSVSWSTGM